MRYAATILLLLGIAVAQILIGGARMLYSIPAMAFLALAALTMLWPGWRAPKTISRACLLSVVVFGGYLIARCLNSPVEYLARTALFIVLGVVAVYAVTIAWVNETKHRQAVVFGFFLIALAHVVVGALQFKNENQWMPIPWVKRTDDWWRASGFFVSPNHFAGFVELVALLAVSFVIWSRWKLWARMLAGYLALVCIFGVAISGSRGGYLSLAAGLMAFALLSIRAIKRLQPEKFVLSVIAAAVMVATMIGSGIWFMSRSEVLKARLAQVNDPENMRWLLWDAALIQWRMEPLWGTGAGTYYYLGRQFRHASVQNDPIHVHNDYLHLLAEYGAVGVALFLLCYFFHARNGWKAIAAQARRAANAGLNRTNGLALTIGALSCVAAYTVHSVVDFNMHLPANAFVIAFLLGVLANPAIQTSRRGYYWQGIVARALGLVAAIAIGVAAIPRFFPEYRTEMARVALRDHLEGDQKLDVALAEAQKAVALDPGNPFAYYFGGEALRVQAQEKGPEGSNDAAQAVRWFENGLRIFPNDVRTVIKLARALDQLGRRDEAEDMYIRAVDLDPNLGNVYAYFGLHYHEQAEFDDAEEKYTEALRLDSANEVAREGLRIIKERREQIRRNVMEKLREEGITDADLIEMGSDAPDDFEDEE